MKTANGNTHTDMEEGTFSVEQNEEKATHFTLDKDDDNFLVADSCTLAIYVTSYRCCGHGGSCSQNKYKQ